MTRLSSDTPTLRLAATARLITFREKGHRAPQRLSQAELEYERGFADAVEGPLEDLYQAGIAYIPHAPFFEFLSLSEWFFQILITTDAYKRLRDILSQQMVAGFDLGGSEALGDLGFKGEVTLRDEELLTEIDGRATRQARYIAQTTARDLARQVMLGRQEGKTTEVIIAAILIFIVSRILYRIRIIAEHEGVWASRRGALALFTMNGIREVEFRTQRDPFVDSGDPGGVCAVQDGRRFRIDRIPERARVPLHFGCRCYYAAVTTGWQPPAVIWRG